MYTAELHETVDAPWTAMDPILVGSVPTGAGTPGIYMTIKRDGEPFARVDAWPIYGGPFTEVLSWGRFVVLGWNSDVHLVDPLTREVHSVECDLYFGHLYPIDDRLLIGTDSHLICVDEQGNVRWKSGRLAIDGVVVDAVRDGGIIHGRGEWDPPEGWQPFRVSLDTGRALAE
jgi:hypothetical protein